MNRGDGAVRQDHADRDRPAPAQSVRERIADGRAPVVRCARGRHADLRCVVSWPVDRDDKATQFAGDDLRKVDPKFQPPRFAQYLEAAGLLERYARQRYDKSLLAFAVRWVLDQRGVSVALWGARHPYELDPVDEVMGWKLDAEALAYVDETIAYAVRDPVGSEFMAPPESAPEEQPAAQV